MKIRITYRDSEAVRMSINDLKKIGKEVSTAMEDTIYNQLAKNLWYTDMVVLELDTDTGDLKLVAKEDV